LSFMIGYIGDANAGGVVVDIFLRYQS